MNRRQFLAGSAIAPLLGGGCGRGPKWERAAYRKTDRSRVAILKAGAYDGRLADIILSGIRLFGLAVSGKTVVLKPNFVEFDPNGVINTHPTVIAASIDAFRTAGAREVIVAEGPAHRRDTEYLVTASGLFPLLKEYRARYVDLNHDDERVVRCRSHYTRLGELHLPDTVLKADLLVSMPKLKTHHWAGVTLAMKNLFGVIPGAIYGWPKNVLHWAGLQESILDVNSTIPVPQFAIVDGIVGMEGNGPIQGTAKPCGVLVLGDDLVAVDATAARLMTIEPGKVPYLARADEFLGNLATERIGQVGERLDPLRQDFRVIDSFRGLKPASA